MDTIELFAGTKSFSKVMEKHGHRTWTLDNNPILKPDVCADILEFSELPYYPDVLWASPPCTCFSVASIGTHWGGGWREYDPKTKEAIIAKELVKRTLKIIKEFKPKYWFIENPRGVLRKMPFMQDLHRVTLSYCQYGDTRMKPTDIWTNLKNWKPKMCKNGAKCHIAAPRGSKTGTQGLKGAIERGKIPEALFEEILNHIKL